jgi:hypothetical protein
MIDVTGIDLVEFAKAVYEASLPQGLGVLHAAPGPLSDEEARSIAEAPKFSMDYVGGRACKMCVSQRDGKLLIADTWYDHTDEQYDELLSQFGLTRTSKKKHGCACNCEKCQPGARSHGVHAAQEDAAAFISGGGSGAN